MGSGLRVVVVCGHQAQDDIQRAFQDHHSSAQRFYLSGAYTIVLQDDKYRVWFLTDGQVIEKVFLPSPEPFISFYLKSVTIARKLRNFFGVASTLSGIWMRYNCWSNQGFSAALMAQLYFERQGSKALLLSDLTTIYREWLYYRGFRTDDDILELQDRAGDLTTGILYVKNLLSHRRTHGPCASKAVIPGQAAASFRDRSASWGSPEAYSAVKELFERLYGAHVTCLNALEEGSSNGKAKVSNDNISTTKIQVNVIDENLSGKEELDDNPQLYNETSLDIRDEDIGGDAEPSDEGTSLGGRDENSNRFSLSNNEIEVLLGVGSSNLGSDPECDPLRSLWEEIPDEDDDDDDDDKDTRPAANRSRESGDRDPVSR